MSSRTIFFKMYSRNPSLFRDELSGIFTKWHFSRLRLFGAAVTHREVDCGERRQSHSSGRVRTHRAARCTFGVKTNQVGQKRRNKKCISALGCFHLL